MKLLGLTLVLLATGAAPASDNRMTLAEANRLSPEALAQRLLGAAGASRHFVEKRVYGNGGGMIASPGLNGIDLYEAPHSAGFEGLCEVDAVNISFESSHPRVPGDQPHRVVDFYKFNRFLIIAPTAERRENADFDALDRDCARLGPVADRISPRLFSVSSDKPVDAYFAMRAVAKAQRAAHAPGSAIVCAPDPAPDGEPVCGDPAASVAGLAIRDAHRFDVERCEDGRWCVTAHWTRSVGGNESHGISLHVTTDARVTDPPSDFGVTSVSLKAETWVDD